MAAAASAGSRGRGGRLALELQAAAEEVLKCGRDQRLFVNESEAVVGRFERALTHLVQQRYEDEAEILDSLTEKEQIVSVVVDATRNRPPSRSKAVHTRKLLAEHSRQWAKVWKANALATTVLGAPSPEPLAARRGAASDGPAEERLRPPIPFLLEAAAVACVALPVLLKLAGGSCERQLLLFWLGLLLSLPFLALQALGCRRKTRLWLLSRLIAGRYQVGGTSKRLGWLWCPTRAYLSGDFEEKGCATFGRWWRLPRAQQGALVSAGRPTADDACPVSLECAGRRWAEAAASLRPSGALLGLPREARFDGTAIFIASERCATVQDCEEVWIKAGCLRFDVLYKLTALLAILGISAAAAAVALPPHLSCGVVVRPPLKAVFLLDGSASIIDSQWESEKQAAKAIATAFGDVYGSAAGKVNLGLVQFSSDAVEELAITSDFQQVAARLDSPAMRQLKGGTDFAKALKLCAEALSAYKGAGMDTFDVCVLVTDGVDGSSLSDDELKALVERSTAIFGIFVGSSPSAERRLQNVTKCGRADAGCDFFASASDFGLLKRKAEDVAEAIKEGVPSHDLPDLSWLPFLPLGVLPCLAWWIWMLLPKWRPRRAQEPQAAAPVAGPVTEERRLRTAGFNEARDTALLPAAGR